MSKISKGRAFCINNEAIDKSAEVGRLGGLS